MSVPRELQLPLVGRDKELEIFSNSITNVKKGKGLTLSLAGEAGIGKTRLVEEFTFLAQEEKFKVLSGTADINSMKPFDIFCKALEEEIGEPLFEEVENTSFAEIFAVNNAGLLLATALPEEEEEVDGDIFAGMLSAVQNFVKDSFDRSGDAGGGLGRLEYGEMKILIEHGEQIYLAAVIKGKEHPDMKRALAKTVREIEEDDSLLMDDWSGDMDEMKGIQERISKLSDIPYTVRKNLEGLKLENERIKMADRVLQSLCDISREKPVLLLLEDLHWSDESSLSVVDYVSRNIRDEPIMVLCTLRSKEGAMAHRMLKKLHDDELLSSIELDKLGENCVKQVVDELYSPNDFPDTLVERLSSTCEGNPFFVIELLKQMEQEGNIERTRDEYKLVEDMISVPNSVEEVVHRRLELLDPNSIGLAEYAACEGGELEKKMVRWFDSGADNFIQPLVDSGILMPEDDKINFSHAIFRDVIYNSLPGWWKKTYHKKLGEYYETNYGNRMHEVYYELARHFSNTNEYEKGHDYSYKAGEKAENALAPEQAIEFYDRSLEALNYLHRVEDKDERRCDIFERIGDMRSLLGDLDDAVIEYNKGLDIAENKGIQAALHRKLGNVFMNTGDYPRSLKECDSALELLDDDDPEVAKVKRVKGRTYMRTGDYDISLDLLNQAFEIAEKNDDRAELAEIAHNQGTVEWYRGRYPEALDRLEYSLELRKDMDDTRGIARASTNIGIVYYSKGDMKKALRYYEKAMISFKKIGDKLNRATVINNMGTIYIYLGELDQAVENFERCLGLFKMVGDKASIATSLNNLGLIMQDKGDLEASLKYHERSLELRRDIEDKQGTAMSLYNIGKVYVDVDKLNESVEHLTHALNITTGIDDLFLSTEIRWDITQAYLKMAEIDPALQKAKEALDISTEIGSRSLEGESRRMLGKVYVAMSEWDEAAEEFKRAKDIFEESGEKIELSQVLVDYGLMWKERGDAVEARDLLKKALEIQEDLGLENDVEQTKDLLDSVKG